MSSPPAELAMPGIWGNGTVVDIMDDEAGVAEALANKLRAHSTDARVVTAIAADAAAVIDLSALRTHRSVADALAVNRGAFMAAKTVAARFARQGGTFITVQGTGGAFGLRGMVSGPGVWTVGLPGLVKTAAKEWPNAAVKAIDIDRSGLSSEEIAARLYRELLYGGPELEVGLQAGDRRITLSLEQADAVPASRGSGGGIDERSVLLVSGGARGVTAAALVALARKCRPRLILLGRTPLEEEPAACRSATDDAGLKRILLEQAKTDGVSITPVELGRRAQRIMMNREIAANLKAMREAGAEVEYLPVDVQQAEVLARALEPIRSRWGPITGIIHGAGVLADKAIEDKTPEQFDYVFGTKVSGLQSLLAATKDDPLDLICLFSSVSARSGNTGQADYAMANEVLNKVAQAEAAVRGDRSIVKSINWGPWDGGMVSPLLKKHFEQMGVGLIPLAEGTAAFVDEVLDASGAVEVVIGGGSAERKTLIEGIAEREWSCELLLQESDMPWLRDHCINGKPVIPAAKVLDWFVRAAAAAHPQLEVSRCTGFSVKKGIVLDDFSQGGHWLRLHCVDRSDGLGAALLRFVLHGPQGQLHYTAEIEMGSTERTADAERLKLEMGAAAVAGIAWDWEKADYYDGKRLFHGPQFQVIQELTTIGDEMAEARFRHEASHTAWSVSERGVDPVMLDGGLQLIRLWGLRTFGESSLPTGIGAYVPYRTMPLDAPVTCRVRCMRHDRFKIVSQVVWLTESGEPIAELRDVDMHVVADRG